MDAVEVVAFKKPVVAAHIPCDISCVGHDLVKLRPCDQPTLMLLEVAIVLKGESRSSLFLQRTGERRWLFALRVKMVWRSDRVLLGNDGAITLETP